MSRRNTLHRALPLCLPFAVLLAGLPGARAGEASHLEEGHAHGTEHRHHAGLFVGGLSRFEHGHKETGTALGLEYEYRLAPRWGLGGLLERVAVGGGRELALVVPLHWHPWRGLKFSAGPGFELYEGQAELLGRVATGYDFHLGRFTLTPEVSADFTQKAQSLVYGLTLGVGF